LDSCDPARETNNNLNQVFYKKIPRRNLFGITIYKFAPRFPFTKSNLKTSNKNSKIL